MENICDRDYLSIFYNLILPVVYEYSPELTIVTTSFKKRKGIQTTPSLYSHIFNSLSCLANGKMCLLINVISTKTNSFSEL
jgi:histone deacetylase 6